MIFIESLCYIYYFNNNIKAYRGWVFNYHYVIIFFCNNSYNKCFHKMSTHFQIQYLKIHHIININS